MISGRSLTLSLSYLVMRISTIFIIGIFRPESSFAQFFDVSVPSSFRQLPVEINGTVTAPVTITPNSVVGDVTIEVDVLAPPPPPNSISASISLTSAHLDGVTPVNFSLTVSRSTAVLAADSVYHLNITVKSQGITPPQQNSTGEIDVIMVAPRVIITATPSQFLSSTLGQPLISTITAVSRWRFTGGVSLNVEPCCLDFLASNRWGWTVTSNTLVYTRSAWPATLAPPTQFTVSDGSPGSTSLSITVPSPPDSFGKFTAFVRASAPNNMPPNLRIPVDFRVLPPFPPSLPCASTWLGPSPIIPDDVIAMNTPLSVLIQAKESLVRPVGKVSVAVPRPPAPAQSTEMIELDIEDDLNLTLDQSRIVLINNSSGLGPVDRGVFAIDQTCNLASVNPALLGTWSLPLPPQGGQYEFVMDRKQVPVITLGLQDKKSTIVDIARFGEDGFWNVFGGRKVTIKWGDPQSNTTSACTSSQCCPQQQPNFCRYCTNLASDTANCGSCGNVCWSGFQCQGSACTCSPPSMVCGVKCVTQPDDDNCGMCGNSCSPWHCILDVNGQPKCFVP